MGIYKFSLWYNSRDNKFSEGTIFSNAPHRTNVLAIDMNSILHDVARVLPRDIPMKDLVEKIWLEINRIVKIVKPTDTLLLAIDGVPPAAKIQQQRQRRFVKQMETAEAVANGEPLGYEGNAINPGTEWMRSVVSMLQTNIKALVRAPPEHWPRQVIFSSDLRPGEGEHKIASYMRTMSETIRWNRNFVVHGADSDLFLIYLNIIDRNPAWNVYLMREREFRPGNIDIKYVNLKRLMRNIKTLWPGSRNAVQDFIFLMNIIGNDFLPHFFNMEVIDKSLNHLFETYTDFIAEFGTENTADMDATFVSRPNSVLGDSAYTALVYDDCRINWSFFADFLDYLRANKEIPMIRQTCTEKRFVDNINVFRNILGDDPLPEDFRRLTYSYAAQYARVGVRPPAGVIAPHNDKPYRRQRNEAMANLFNNKKVVLYRSNFVNKMCIEYLRILTWAYTYYVRGSEFVNLDAYYPFAYAPYLFDLTQFMRTEESIRDIETHVLDARGSWLSPTEQMLCVMPRDSHHLIRVDFRPITSTLKWMYPTAFTYDTNMKLELFMGTALIEPANIDVVRAAVNAFIRGYRERGDIIDDAQYASDTVTILNKRVERPPRA